LIPPRTNAAGGNGCGVEEKVMSADELAKLTEGKDRMTGAQSLSEPGRAVDKHPVPLRNFFLATIALTLCFAFPLYDLIRFAFGSDVYSHILLIPFISAFLIWSQRQSLPRFSRPARKMAAFFLAGGLVVIAGYWLTVRFAPRLAVEDYLTFNILAFLLFFVSGCGRFLGKEILRAIAFPIGLLVFIIPFPVFLMNWIEAFLQQGSATVADWLFSLSGMAYFRDGLVFRLPGINLQVAPECSGIHSTLALFITSLLAGHYFLRKPWKRVALALAVVPLALLRNGFRIFVIGQLCVHVSPDMINSPIHHRGGPLFFILSLIPFFLLLIFLNRSEHARQKSSPQGSEI
jgi:exosortase C (VPDSG-CTERM-specific)